MLLLIITWVALLTLIVNTAACPARSADELEVKATVGTWRLLLELEAPPRP
jgi:hypothetical protein